MSQFHTINQSFNVLKYSQINHDREITKYDQNANSSRVSISRARSTANISMRNPSQNIQIQPQTDNLSENYHTAHQNQTQLMNQIQSLKNTQLNNEKQLKSYIYTLEQEIKKNLKKTTNTQTLKNENQLLREQNTKLINANNFLRNQLQQAKICRDQYSSQLQKIRMDVGSRIDSLIQKIDILSQSEYRLSENNQQLKEQNHQLYEQKISYLKMIQALKSIIKKYEDDYSEKTKQILTINKKYNYLLGQYERTQKRYLKKKGNFTKNIQQNSEQNNYKTVLEKLLDEIEKLDQINIQLNEKLFNYQNNNQGNNNTDNNNNKQNTDYSRTDINLKDIMQGISPKNKVTKSQKNIHEREYFIEKRVDFNKKSGFHG